MLLYQDERKRKGTQAGKACLLSGNWVQFTGGAHIGEEVGVVATVVVKKVIPEYTVAAGVLAKSIYNNLPGEIPDEGRLSITN